VAVIASAPYCYRTFFHRVEEEVRARVTARIAERLPHLVVQVRSAHLTADGIEVRGLSIAEPGAPGPQPEIAYFDEVFLTCRTSLQELLSSEPEVSAVRLNRPVIRATRRPDGSFSLGKLFPLPKCERPLPATTIEDGTIVVFDPLKNPSSTLTLRDINLIAKRSTAEGADPLLVELEGYMVADQIQRVEVSGTFDPTGQRWSAVGTIDGLSISPELRQALPERFSRPLESLNALRASATATFRVSSEGPGEVPRFEVNGRVTHGHLEDPLLPYPVTDLQAEIHCDNTSIQVKQLSARHGPTIWQMPEFVQSGYEARSPFVLRASARQVRLDSKWARTLPKPWSTYWQDYDPEGEVDLDCTLTFDGDRIKPSLKATCLNNVSFSFFKFPYRLEGGRGTITLADDVMDVNLTAYSDAQFQQDDNRDAVRASDGSPLRSGAPVTFNGRFYNPGPRFTGSIDIKADRIQFDEKLFAALLKPKARETLRSLRPHGTFRVETTLWRQDPNRRELHQSAKIVLDRCSMDYEKFPLPLSNVHGVLFLKDGQWSTERELLGTNGTGIVGLSGTLNTSDDEDVLSLAIKAENFPLHEELRDALSPSQRQLWYALQPHGKIDLNANVRYESRTKKTTVTLRAFPRDDSTSIGTSIEPVSFPYRMRLHRGSIFYHDGHAELENLDVAHGGTHMRTMGSCDLAADGGWRLLLRDMRIDRLRLHGEDHELEAALPDALKRAIAELKPTGPINVTGALEFAKSAPDAPLHAGWDVDLTLTQASLQAGPKLENIFGKVRLTGAADGTLYSSRGELALDSLTYKNFQLKEVNGPIWFDNQTVRVGHWGGATPGPAQATRHVTANLLGGTLTGDCHVKLGALPHYHLIATLSQADLRQFASENMPNHQDLRGKIQAGISLQGNGGPRNLVGTGTIHLSDANVYKLPVMVSLLKIARAKTPDSTAFTESDIAFGVQGEHVTLNEIHLSGDAISLSGQGDITLDGQTNPIALQLHTTVGRGNLPLVSSILHEASQQIMTINVNGTLDNPVAHAEAFPGARGALQQLQADGESSNLLPPRGSIMRAIGIGR
jgi:hypothetical protein